jgi:N-acetylglucosaminyldiphosphoundecaprenol N-acetyl-beta-D-mannosaminyltransferase
MRNIKRKGAAAMPARARKAEGVSEGVWAGDATAALPAAGVALSPIGSLPSIELLGARLRAITETQCVEVILDSLDRNCGGSVATINLDHLRRFVDNPRYAALCRKATILTADGMPLIWASRLQGTALPERVTGSNLILSLTAAAARRGRSVFLLGGAPGAAQQAAGVLRQRHPGIRIAGFSSQPHPASEAGSWGAVADMLRAAQPDIIFVAMGSPRQEELIEVVRGILPNAWWLGVGIAFSFVAGTIPRAPLWMQRMGLEWFHRLLQEPRRLAGRYLIQGLPFAGRLLASSVLQALSAKRYL